MLNELPSMHLPVQYTPSKSCVWETGMSTALRSTFGEIHYEDDTLCQSMSDSRRGDASQ